MTTTDEIMGLADKFAGSYRVFGPEDAPVIDAREALLTAIEQLVAQAAWAHHTPALLSDADAAADLAGVARPGAEPVLNGAFLERVLLAMEGVIDVADRNTDEFYALRSCVVDLTLALYARPSAPPAQARQPGAEPVAWQRRMRPTWGNGDALWGPWEECSKGQAEDCWSSKLLNDWVYEARALYTAPTQASQPLTGEEWFDFWRDNDAAPGNSVFPEFLRLARAIESAHGIGAQKGKL